MAQKANTVDNTVKEFSLGLLNRHWYRRCLDGLNQMLDETPANPGLMEIKNLCDKILTGFLTAVTGQAPDLGELQFPADRAYYFPFDGDRVGSFNFAKAYFKLTEMGPWRRSNKYKDYENSLWSFFPWDAQGLNYKVDEIQSVDSKGLTISFQEMISSRSTGATSGASKNADMVFIKSLLLADDEDDLARQVMAKGLVGKKSFEEQFNLDMNRALIAIFEIYRRRPGDSLAESVLINHVHVIRWLRSRLLKVTGDEGVGIQQEQGFRELFQVFLRAYLLDGVIPDPDHFKDPIPQLESFLDEDGDTGKRSFLKAMEGLQESDLNVMQSPFFKNTQDFVGKEIKLEPNESQDATETEPFEKVVLQFGDLQKYFDSIRADLVSFKRYFMRGNVEGRLIRDLKATMGDALLFSGDTRESFVWVSPDFETFDSNYYHLDKNDEEFTTPEDIVPDEEEETGEDPAKREKQEIPVRLVDDICLPYVHFFQVLDVESLKRGGLNSELDSYWRILGDALRTSHIHTSFDNKKAKLNKPGLASKQLSLSAKERGIKASEHPHPRPQNIFLRIRICDTAGEPMLNGLFTFSRDFDEVTSTPKSDVERKEDIKDLLSFAKVYFFIVRDYFRSLDRARESRDIGRLNQFLYDQQISRLDKMMDERLRSKRFIKDGVTDESNRHRFIYEVINQYARTLQEKPGDIKGETFPFDRLLVLPLSGRMQQKQPYHLPFYLFQSLYLERKDRLVDGNYYSLVKPFQSPIEKHGQKSGEQAFQVKSFQETTGKDKDQTELPRFLEKVFVSQTWLDPETKHPYEHADNSAANLDDPLMPSFVVKAMEENDFHDSGWIWAKEALDSFWISQGFSKEQEDRKELWLEDLDQLTLLYRDEVLGDREGDDESHNGMLGFAFRFAILRTTLEPVIHNGKDANFKQLNKSYSELLRRKYEEREDLNILRMIEESYSDRGATFLPTLRKRLMPRDVHRVIFSSDLLSGSDVSISFLKHLSEAAANQFEAVDTWYQPLLTRPYESEKDLKKKIAKSISKRLPAFDRISNKEDGLAIFSGFTFIGFGKDDDISDQYPYMVVMIRDYDDRKSLEGKEDQQVKEQLEVDRRDLELFTSTYFRSVSKFLSDAIRQEEVQLLSTDITQIARNWYSTGMDVISRMLRDRLEYLVLSEEKARLDHFRHEIADSLFKGILEVLLREEKNADDDAILMESFPFDRIIHIPLNLNLIEGARLAYARTCIAPTTSDAKKQGLEDEELAIWGKPCDEDIYQEIRDHGRTWDNLGGDKVIATDKHNKPKSFMLSVKENGTASFTDAAAVMDPLNDLFEAHALDGFIRRLYEAKTLQSASLCGLALNMAHLAGGNSPSALKIKNRLAKVLADSVTSIEREWNKDTQPVYAVVDMDRSVIMPDSSVWDDTDHEGHRDENLKIAFNDVKTLPLFRDFFRTMEGERHVYGLGSSQKPNSSRVFYVYYAVPAPQNFYENAGFSRVYRGIYCLVVDDASTASQNAVLESADQQDIKTFIHNAARYLKLTLDEQALHHQIKKPGLDDVIVGTLHRIKNDLGMPISVLDTVESYLKFMMGMGGQQDITVDSLLNALRDQLEEAGESGSFKKISSAKESLQGFTDLFQKLKRLSEFKQDVIPLRTFNSNWLGWLFVEKVANALDKVVLRDHEKRHASLKNSLRLSMEHAESCKENPGRGPGVNKERIQLALSELSAIITDLYKQDCPEVILSYAAYTNNSIVFYGSFLLEEALEILVENAFQAFWDYLVQAVSGDHQLENQPALLRMTCFTNPDQRDEACIFMENSSLNINQKTIDTMNAEVPKPITSKEHKRQSGKAGGSGFGHYYARRIINDYCGGDRWQKKLDIRFQYNMTHMAQTEITLVRCGERGVSYIHADHLIASLERFAAANEAQNHANPRILFPASVRPEHLAHVMVDFLRGHQELLEKELADLIQRHICRKITDHINRVRKELDKRLQAYLQQSKENVAALQPFRIALSWNNRHQIRRGSFSDLTNTLANLKSEHAHTFKAITEALDLTAYINEQDDWREKPDASLFKVLNQPRTVKGAEADFEPFLDYFPHETSTAFDFFKNMIVLDEAGCIRSDLQEIQKTIGGKVWDLKVKERDDSFSVRLSIVLKQGKTQTKQQKPSKDQDNLKLYQKVKAGFTLLDYRDAILMTQAGTQHGALHFQADHRHLTLELDLPVAIDEQTPAEAV